MESRLKCDCVECGRAHLPCTQKLLNHLNSKKKMEFSVRAVITFKNLINLFKKKQPEFKLGKKNYFHVIKIRWIAVVLWFVSRAHDPTCGSESVRTFSLLLITHRKAVTVIYSIIILISFWWQWRGTRWRRCFVMIKDTSFIFSFMLGSHGGSALLHQSWKRQTIPLETTCLVLFPLCAAADFCKFITRRDRICF